MSFSLLRGAFFSIAHLHFEHGERGGSEIGVFDFAGGLVIRTSAGLGSLAAALVLGHRKNFGPDIMVPHNIPACSNWLDPTLDRLVWP